MFRPGVGRIGIASTVGLGVGMVAGANLVALTSTEFVMVFGLVMILTGTFWTFLLLVR